MPRTARRSISRHEELRRQFGFTVTELADRVEFSHAYVSMVEGGTRKPSPRYRRKVAECLEIPEARIFPELEHTT
jgi:transcriptional regulator with XRE-family HTH domain